MRPIVPLLSVSLSVTDGSHKTDVKFVALGVTFKSLGCSSFRPLDIILCLGQPKLEMDLQSFFLWISKVNILRKSR